MKKFEELKERFANEIISEEEFDEINETEWVCVENNGSSGKEIGCTWWTAQEVVGENEIVNEFDFYTK